MDQHEATTAGTPPLTPEFVFREYAPRVYNLARRMLSSDADAEDVTQNVLVQVVRKLPTFRGDARFSTWVYRIAYNCCLKQLELRKREKALQTAMQEEQQRTAAAAEDASSPAETRT